MARPNQGRSIDGEANLAARIRRERAERGWSPADLAAKMTAAGCSMQTSAIYKIEDREKPRRITFDEVIALERVFGVSIDNLRTPVDELDRARAETIVKEFMDGEDGLGASIAKLVGAYVTLLEITTHEKNLELAEYTENLLQAGGEAPRAGLGTYLFEVFDEEHNPLPIDQSRLDRAVTELYMGAITTASEIVSAKFGASRLGGDHGKR